MKRDVTANLSFVQQEEYPEEATGRQSSVQLSVYGNSA